MLQKTAARLSEALSMTGNESDWSKARAKAAGPPDRSSRFDAVAETMATARRRNRETEKGGCGCPILVEGKRDRVVFRSLGYTGPIELYNRGWDMSRLCAWLYETYGTRNLIDGSSSIIVVMDWDRTGGRLQRELCRRLESMDMQIDSNLRKQLGRFLNQETSTVEGMKGSVNELKMRIDLIDFTEEE